MREPRLGDDIDDYCVRCKRVMNHSIVSVLGGQPAKVRCRTCHSDHDYRHEQPPPPKVDLRKQALFNDVLKKVSPGDAAAAEADPELPVDTVLDADDGLDAEAPEGESLDAETAAPAETPAAQPAPKTKGKHKAKAVRKK